MIDEAATILLQDYNEYFMKSQFELKFPDLIACNSHVFGAQDFSESSKH